MRWRLASILFLIALSALAPLPGSGAQARSRDQAAEMAAFFHDDLAPYGRWVNHRIYGVVWVPDSGQPDWHPYWNGRWVWTTDYGWYWHSYEPYGWATYHYGRWVLTSDLGWVWVPGSEWGPAWVEWRYYDGHAGWAPMPPERDRGASGATVEARAWIFVPEGEVGKTRGMQQATTSRAAELLAGSTVTAGADLAARLGIEAQALLTVDTPAAVATASANGQAAIYRPSRLPGLEAATPGALKLDVPVDTSTDLDTEAAANAKARLEDAAPPEKSLSGSVESAIGGTFGGERTMRGPSAGSGIGIGVPAVGGGLGIGR